MQTVLGSIRDLAIRLAERPSDLEPLLEQVGERELVLLGEATHGTSEFYRLRADISRRLIEDRRFELVAVEGDFPDVARLNAWVLGDLAGEAEDAFGEFERFPRWMWRNREMLAFVSWLREHNAALPRARRVRLYGLDLYSLYRSAEAVIACLDEHFPELAGQARDLWECLDGSGDPQRYGYEAAAGIRAACGPAVRELLAALVGRGVPTDHPEAQEAFLHARHNMRVVANAEAWYRALFDRHANTWNLRDRHMAESLRALQDFHRARGGSGKAVVWAHNSHLGDARATEMGRRGDLNLGQLMRQQVGRDNVLLVGFTTWAGRVAAAREWDGEVEHFTLRPARLDSIEHQLHESGLECFFLPLDDPHALPLRQVMLERAVGVVYRPRSERASHYFEASVASQFDALFHVDESSAVEPFDLPGHWHVHARVPETWPYGL